MNNIDQQYKELLNAQKNFLSYALRVTYGNKLDIVYNIEMANYWDNIIKLIKEKIIINNK